MLVNQFDLYFFNCNLLFLFVGGITFNLIQNKLFRWEDNRWGIMMKSPREHIVKDGLFSKSIEPFAAYVI